MTSSKVKNEQIRKGTMLPMIQLYPHSNAINILEASILSVVRVWNIKDVLCSFVTLEYDIASDKIEHLKKLNITRMQFLLAGVFVMS